MRRLMIPVGILLLAGPAVAQYTREWQSGNLEPYAWGASYGYDVDGDGFGNLWTRSSSGQLTIYDSSLTVYWAISIPGYDYPYLATPRDIDGDGLIVPVNLDGDPAGELVVSAYRLDGSVYSGRIRVYDVLTRQLAWESPELSGFSGNVSLDDVDGDGRYEIIITRTSFAGGWGYVEVYGYAGAGLEGEPGYFLESSRAVAEPSVCRDGTVIRFRLNIPGRTRLSVFDSAGRQVRELLDADLPVGEYRVNWDGADDAGDETPAGAYVYRLNRGGAVEVGRLVRAR